MSCDEPVALFRPMRESIIVRVSFGTYGHVNFIVGCSACTMSSQNVHVRYIIS